MRKLALGALVALSLAGTAAAPAMATIIWDDGPWGPFCKPWEEPCGCFPRDIFDL